MNIYTDDFGLNSPYDKILQSNKVGFISHNTFDLCLNDDELFHTNQTNELESR